MSIYTVKANPSDCPPREKQAALCILAATCWAINTHTALEKIPRIMVLCEKDRINAEKEGRKDILWGKKDFHLQKNKILSFHRWWNKMLTNIVSPRTWIHITSDNKLIQHIFQLKTKHTSLHLQIMEEIPCYLENLSQNLKNYRWKISPSHQKLIWNRFPVLQLLYYWFQHTALTQCKNH